jgi:hypothetical protein
MADMGELLARCEAADGPDRRLDADIYEALGFGVIRDGMHNRSMEWRYKPPGESYWVSLPPLTASIDSSLALVERLLPLPYGTLNFGLYDGVAQISVDTDDHQTIDGAVVQTTASSTGQARTLPLAILAALLRALAQQKQGEQK